jgi:hypothetical protein
MYKYYGITYPSFLSRFPWIWRRTCCKFQWHLFDECTTENDRYLHCDACGLIVHILSVDGE